MSLNKKILQINISMMATHSLFVFVCNSIYHQWSDIKQKEEGETVREKGERLSEFLILPFSRLFLLTDVWIKKENILVCAKTEDTHMRITYFFFQRERYIKKKAKHKNSIYWSAKKRKCFVVVVDKCTRISANTDNNNNKKINNK